MQLHHYLYCLFGKVHLNPFSVSSHPRRALTMSDNQIIKAEKDFSKDADKLIPEAETLAQVYCGNDVAWIRVLISMQFRPASKAPSTSFLSWRSKRVKLVRF